MCKIEFYQGQKHALQTLQLMDMVSWHYTALSCLQITHCIYQYESTQNPASCLIAGKEAAVLPAAIPILYTAAHGTILKQ